MNLNVISRHRTVLMGFATLMIIACHASSSGVLMPYIFQRLLGIGNFGVDIFLFLSGLGCFYSLSKDPDLLNYFKKRYVRIFTPYLLITAPFALIYLLLGEYSFRDVILSLTTFDYWIEHKGAWFVALLIPLYLISPILLKALSGSKKFFNLTLMILLIISICNINAENLAYGNIISNIQNALQRVPSYLMGMTLGKYCQQSCEIKLSRLIICLLGGSILYIACYFLLKDIFVGWLLVPLLIFLLIKFIELFPFLSGPLNQLGKVSLESYLSNIYINHFLRILIPIRISSELFYGRYLEYSIVIVLGLTIAFAVNKPSDRIIKFVMNAK